MCICVCVCVCLLVLVPVHAYIRSCARLCSGTTNKNVILEFLQSEIGNSYLKGLNKTRENYLLSLIRATRLSPRQLIINIPTNDGS